MRILVIILLALSAHVVRAADRVALVIGNSRYAHLQPLEASLGDAAKMVATFQKIGIRIHGGKPLIDLTSDQMDKAVSEFAQTLGPDSEAFLYYSGHGLQIAGSNYLLPVGFDAAYENQARRQAISLDSILELLERSPSKLRVIILDACRDPGNLLPGEPKSKGVAPFKGLGEQKVEAPETLVCFATKHGTTAIAGAQGSPYTDILAEEIARPGEIASIMRIVTRRVYEATNSKQLPFTYGNLLHDHFFAAPPGPAASVAIPPPPTSSPSPPPNPVNMAKLSPPASPVILPPGAVPRDSIAHKKELLFADDFEGAEPGKAWHKVVPTFTVENGALKGTQTRDQNIPATAGKPAFTAHAAVHGLELPTRDSVFEARIRFAGATMIDVEFDDRKYTGSHYGHICRAQVRLDGITIIDEKEGAMRNEIYELSKDPAKKNESARLLAGRSANFPVNLQAGKWYSLVIETVRDTMRVTIDGQPAAFLKSPGIAHATKSKIELGVAGKDGYFDDLKVWNAEPAK